MPAAITVFSWRDAIQKSSLEPTTRFVLLNLSIYMNEKGEGCYPSIETQAENTGLSPRAVITHLQKAADAQFLIITKHGLAGQKWKRNEYRAVYPNDMLTLRHQDVPVDAEGGEPRSLPLLPEGGERSDVKVVNDVHTNSPVNSTLEDIDKKTKAKKSKKGEKVLIADWEAKNGKLAVPMMRPWIDGNQLDPAKVHAMIVEFRDRMAANGNLYADFVAAFKDWLRRGFLTRKMEQCRVDKIAHATLDLSTKGLSL